MYSLSSLDEQLTFWWKESRSSRSSLSSPAPSFTLDPADFIWSRDSCSCFLSSSRVWLWNWSSSHRLSRASVERDLHTLAKYGVFYLIPTNFTLYFLEVLLGLLQLLDGGRVLLPLLLQRPLLLLNHMLVTSCKRRERFKITFS